MPPVSPVFHTEVTVRIGIKTQLEWEHPFHKIRCLFHGGIVRSWEPAMEMAALDQN